MRLFPFVVLCAFLIAGCAQTVPQEPAASTGNTAAKQINSFEDCVAAGNPVMESNPRQCSSDGKTFTEVVPDNAGEPAPEAPSQNSNEALAVKEFRVEAYQWGFSPDPITVNKGDRVKITFTSRDVTHGVSLPDFGVNTKSFGKGEEVTVEFVADKTGTFSYRCSVYCGSGHKDMTGVLIVQ